MKQKLAIFLSGSGSNARNICTYFQNHEKIEVALLLSNKENSVPKLSAKILEYRITSSPESNFITPTK
jgi:folate-dependent phosphoribosylglycinamide formyltransferase PurN